MPGAANNGLDGRQLAKLVALLDSPQEAEAAGALHRIRAVAKKHGLTIYEAVEDDEYKTGIWEAFAPECLRDYFERKQGGNEAQLREDIAHLQAALTAREHDIAEVVDRYEARLAEVVSAAKSTPQSHRGVGEFLGYTWSFAQWRMVLLLALVAAQIGTTARLPRWTALPFAAAGIWLFLLWCAAEIDESGWGRLLIKLGIVGAGCIAVYAQPDFAAVILGSLTLLAATRLINNLSDRLMEVPVVATVIGWFV